MSEITYIGEHLLPGRLGHLLVVTSFVASILATVAFYRSYLKNEDSEAWYQTGRWAFLTHGISILTAMGIVVYIMINKYYEYHYVWTHVNDELPFRYIFSAFWEGQEGSFSLWIFWHVILGFVLLTQRNKWSGGVMGTLSFVQVFITSMLLGVYVFGQKIGSSPFALLRDVMDIPLFANAQYLDLIDGNGLNPLLQNYWMTIHPPTTFVGFASLTIPFAFAVAAILKKDMTGWFEKVLPWGLFSGAILGTGILMGAAWAYEALSFGGYWSWDPVENSSLVPWLIMIAGIHTNLIARHTGRSQWATLFFYYAAFILIVYSTFLTRSGVLGDTSVHAFTEMGLEWQLLLFLLFFLVWGGYLLARAYPRLAEKKEEEPVASREFWMFIGSLILLFSSILILFTTSIPVYNKLFTFFGELFGQDWTHLHRTAPIDAIEHYNKYQLWIAALISLLSGVAIFLRYNAVNWATNRKETLSRYGIQLALSAVLTYVLTLWIDAYHWTYMLLAFTSVFGVIANLDYIVRFTGLKTKPSAAALSHWGFAVMIIGIMASGLNKEYISTNKFAQAGLLDGEQNERLNRNIILIKGAPMFMNDYWVTYVSDTMVGNLRKYLIHYRHVDSSGQKKEDFFLRPQVVYDNKVTKVASVNPSTKHYLSKDIFTHIAAIPPQLMDIEEARKIEDTLTYKLAPVMIGDTFDIKEGVKAILTGINDAPEHPDYVPEPNDIAVGAQIRFINDFDDDTLTAEPIIVLRGNLIYRYSEQVNQVKTRLDIAESLFDSEQYEDGLEFTSYQLKMGETVEHDGFSFTLKGFTEEVSHPGYEAQDGDIAIAGVVEVSKGGYSYTLKPVYIIRNSQQFSLTSFDAMEGVHARLEKIDPTSELIELNLASGRGIKETPIPIKFATNVPRTDYIVLEAIVFPGINLFWLGSVTMMIGLFVGMAERRKQKMNG
jgi:cytochrome c-type biogenesis protein CcmF